MRTATERLGDEIAELAAHLELRPDEAAVVRRALEAAMERAWSATDVPAETPPASLRRADALVAVAERYLAGGDADAAVEVLRADHRTAGIEIDAWAAYPRWDGRAVDYDHAVFCLVGARRYATA